jgi:menaquinone-dependent protoporphyrinogen oxidase
MINKKQIVKYAGILLLVLVSIVASSLVLVKTTLPRSSGIMSEGSCKDIAAGSNPASPLGEHRALVTYASKYSSTAGVAQVIMETLCHQGFSVDLRWVQNVKSVEGYDAVIIGSPIYWGFWLPPATDFLTQQQQALSKKTLAYFILANVVREGKDTPENRQKAKDAFIQPLLDDHPVLAPIENFGIFGGRIKRSTLGWFETFMMDLMGFEDNDSRDFKKVENWSNEIGSEITDRAAS